jgi:DNA-directed RNA polymerase subunit beta'
MSFAVRNLNIPKNKKDIVVRADRDVLEIQKQYMDGLITDGERYKR